MTPTRSPCLRQVVAALLTVCLTLAGVGRGRADAFDGPGPGFAIPGVAAHICHTGAGDGSAPADPAGHDCCDACALLAPVALPLAPTLWRPTLVARDARHARPAAWRPTVARPRTPRQAQGPPTA